MTEYAAVSDLKPHELNDEIYTNKNVDELVEKITAYGFKETHPLVVTEDNKILSGHRRWRAAKEVGLSEVPVQRTDPEDKDDELLTLLLANKYRDKTPAEKIKEGEAWERIESKKAKERLSDTGGSEPGPPNLDDPTKKGRTDEKVAEKLGVSKNTYRNGKKVKDKAEQGDETAQKEWEKLEAGEQSIHGAYRKVKQNENALSDPEQDAPAETPQPKALEYEWVNTTTKDVSIQARDCDTTGKYRLYVSGEEYTIEAGLYSKLFEKNP